MKTGVLVSARLGSTRLPQKHLLELDGRPIFYYLLERINTEFKAEIARGEVEVIICSSDEPMNEELRQFDHAKLFLGDIRNIPKRQVQAARAFSLDQIIAVDGDDILCSKAGMRSVYDALSNGANYVSTKNLPFGMNSMGYKAEFLNRCMADYMNMEVLETGWGRIFDAGQKKEIEFKQEMDYELLRFTLDYQADFDFFLKVITSLGDKVFEADDEEIFAAVRANRYYDINSYLLKEYWENFHKQVAKEGEAQ